VALFAPLLYFFDSAPPKKNFLIYGAQTQTCLVSLTPSFTHRTSTKTLPYINAEAKRTTNMKRQFEEISTENDKKDVAPTPAAPASESTEREVRPSNNPIRTPAVHFDWTKMRAGPLECKPGYKMCNLFYRHSDSNEQMSPFVQFYKQVIPFPPRIQASKRDGKLSCTLKMAMQEDDNISRKFVDGRKDFLIRNAKENRMAYFPGKASDRTDLAIEESVQNIVFPSFNKWEKDPITGKSGPAPGAIRYEDSLEFAIPLTKQGTPRIKITRASTNEAISLETMQEICHKKRMYVDVLAQLYCHNFSSGSYGIKPQVVSLVVRDNDEVPVRRREVDCLPEKYSEYANAHKNDSIYDANGVLKDIPDPEPAVKVVSEFEVEMSDQNVTFSREEVDRLGMAKIPV
jgi:hypothetical protein